MDYKEKYEVRMRERQTWIVLGEFSSEDEAANFMKKYSDGTSGSWRVVRVSEVTMRMQTRA